MTDPAFWTASHVTGMVLVLSVVSGLGAYQYMLVRDKNRPIIFGQPPHEWLRLVHEHPRPWRVATISFMCATLGTTLGLAVLALLLQRAGDPGFSAAGVLAFAFGAVLWIINLAARLSIDPWAGNEQAATGNVPSIYEPTSRWNGVLFVIFTLLTFSGVTAFGAAILATSLLPHWLGWAAIIYSVLGLAQLALTRDSLPALHSTMPLVMGIALLAA
ncbi:MAG TPA: hypothetical protein VF916_06295 [Ktedonobacterales bacterium]